MRAFTTGLVIERRPPTRSQKEVWPGQLENFLSPQRLPELYQRRVALGGQPILPIHCAEQQNDHVRAGRSNAYIGLNYRVQQHTRFCVETNDGSLDARLYYNAQLKYGMHHNGDHGDNEMRKKVALGTVRKLLEFCNAQALLAFLDETKAAHFEIDDLAEAFSLMLQKALQMFHERKQVLGWEPGQSIPVAGFDFGTRNYALCIGEVTAVDEPREETYVTWENETVTHVVERPHFRVFRWQLLDLIDGKVSADYRGPSDVYARLDKAGNVTASAYDPVAFARITRNTQEGGAGATKKRQKKKRAPEEDASRTKKRARTTTKKRAREEDDAVTGSRAKRARPLLIDIRDDE